MPRKKKTEEGSNFMSSLFSDGIEGQDDSSWPEYEDLPYNFGTKKVDGQVFSDLLSSPSPLVITGYASLEKVIELLAGHLEKGHPTPKVRLLFGHEPTLSKSAMEMRLEPLPLEQEMRDYWVEKNINPLQIVNLFESIRYLESGSVEIRFPKNLHRVIHAKIYVGSDTCTLGSSNFTNAGLKHNIEGNVRFRENAGSKNWKIRTEQLAECIWNEGKDGTALFIELLRDLRREVDWQTALARACNEVLGDEWLEECRKSFSSYSGSPLWPTQEEGIARALCVLRTSGAVLVADAAGSGKTKMGTHLLRHLIHGLWSSSRARKDLPVLITPPDSVQESWDRESVACGIALNSHSYGLLSKGREEKREPILAALQRGQILAIDEAHRFYGKFSERARQVRNNLADYRILLTATPINRGIQDLVALIDLLGADNLRDETHEVLAKLWKARSSDKLLDSLTRDEIRILREEIRNFTVRRTRTQLNRMVDASPDDFSNHLGEKCRYPEAEALNYDTGETEEDSKTAQRIVELAKKLKGLNYFRKEFVMPESLKAEGMTEQDYLSQRLSSATALERYLIAESLRSSRAALVEHLEGTKESLSQFGIRLAGKSQKSGNIIKSIEEMKMPESSLPIDLPDWLSNPQAFEKAKENELENLREISKLVKSISESRELRKARILIERADKPDTRVLAFDRHPISLAQIRDLVERESDVRTLVVGSDSKKLKRQAEKVCSLDYRGPKTVLLCSDAMSEGINLQGASVMIHLDFPSVIRVVEQREGRIIRMDSHHQKVSILWPADGKCFKPGSTDEKLLKRHRITSTLLGANINLPFGKRKEREEDDSESSDDADDLDDIRDVFEEVEALVEGSRAIVSRETYDSMKDIRAKVVAKVSVVRTKESSWAFFCMKGTQFRPPQWVFMSSSDSTLETNLTQVARKLRERLDVDTEKVKFDVNAAKALERFLKEMDARENELLPPFKQRALRQMKEVLIKLRESRSAEYFDLVEKIMGMLETNDAGDKADIRHVADAWLATIQEFWSEELKNKRRRKPLRLMDKRIIKLLSTERAPSPDELRKNFQSVPKRIPDESRWVAAIVGLKK
jgi:superfamily II DNA/RNA helicase